MAEVYLKYKNKDGTVAERGLVSKQGIKKSELEQLLNAIRQANPNIKIERDLIDRVNQEK
jgi:ribosomal protein S8